MASVFINSNFPVILADINAAVEKVADKEFIPRIVANGLLDVVPFRIHNEGRGSNGEVIGPYSKRYYEYRQKKPFNRDAQPNVVVSLTRQLENDWSVIATPKGYGLGFKNAFNKQKLFWVEQVRQTKIGELTAGEIEYITETVQEELINAFK